MLAALFLCLLAVEIARRRRLKRFRDEVDRFMEWGSYEKIDV